MRNILYTHDCDYSRKSYIIIFVCLFENMQKCVIFDTLVFLDFIIIAGVVS